MKTSDFTLKIRKLHLTFAPCLVHFNIACATNCGIVYIKRCPRNVFHTTQIFPIDIHCLIVCIQSCLTTNIHHMTFCCLCLTNMHHLTNRTTFCCLFLTNMHHMTNRTTFCCLFRTNMHHMTNRTTFCCLFRTNMHHMTNRTTFCCLFRTNMHHMTNRTTFCCLFLTVPLCYCSNYVHLTKYVLQCTTFWLRHIRVLF